MKDAVTYIEGVPYWDIKAPEVAFPFVIEENVGGRPKEFLTPVVLSQHTDPQSQKGTAAFHKQTLREGTTEMRISGDEMQLPSLNESPLKAYVDKHFIRLEKVGLPVEKHADWLDRNAFTKVRIFRECVQGVRLDDEAADAAAAELGDLLQLTLDASPETIPLIQQLYSTKEEKVATIRIAHTWGPANEVDFNTHRKASSQSFNSRKKLLTTRENYDVLEQLYDRKIVEVIGLCVDGTPCREANKADWTPFVPLEQKLLVLDLIFRKARVKNV